MENEATYRQTDGIVSVSNGNAELFLPLDNVVKNIPRVWGIRRSDLDSLPYRNLRSAFIGVYNLIIPYQMMDVMNPDEIMAKYIAAGEEKPGNRHRAQRAGDIFSHDFLTLIREMDDIAYPLGQVEWQRRFSGRQYSQKARLEKLDSSVRETFVNSFFSDYRPLNSENGQRENPDAISDPNIDGRSSRVYTSRIYNYLRNRADVKDKK